MNDNELINLRKKEIELETTSIDYKGGQGNHNQKLINTKSKDHATINYEYLRNIFVKYLEYLAQGNQKELLTIERVLFLEL